MGSRYYVPKNNAFGDICDTIRDIRATMAAMENASNRHASLLNSEANLYRKSPTVNSREPTWPENVVPLGRCGAVLGAMAKPAHQFYDHKTRTLVQSGEQLHDLDSMWIVAELIELLAVDVEALVEFCRRRPKPVCIQAVGCD